MCFCCSFSTRTTYCRWNNHVPAVSEALAVDQETMMDVDAACVAATWVTDRFPCSNHPPSCWRAFVAESSRATWNNYYAIAPGPGNTYSRFHRAGAAPLHAFPAAAAATKLSCRQHVYLGSMNALQQAGRATASSCKARFMVPTMIALAPV